MRLQAALLLALLPAALAAQAGPSSEADLNVRIKGFRNRILLDTLAIWKPVPGSAVQTFRNTLKVLDSLEIPVQVADSVRGVISHSGFVARGRFAGKSVSHSFRCGMGLSGDYADSWRVSVAYAIFVKPDKDDSRVGLAFVAGANDVEGVSKPAVQCGTTGVLESSLSKILGLKGIQ